jgi:hypothetical protein
VTEPENDAYARGMVAGEVAARLADHDRHFAMINGSIERLAGEVHAMVLGIQRLGDSADADRATVVTTARALEKADAARRDKTEAAWSPVQRLYAVLATVGAAIGIVLAVRGL